MRIHYFSARCRRFAPQYIFQPVGYAVLMLGFFKMLRQRLQPIEGQRIHQNRRIWQLAISNFMPHRVEIGKATLQIQQRLRGQKQTFGHRQHIIGSITNPHFPKPHLHPSILRHYFAPCRSRRIRRVQLIRPKCQQSRQPICNTIQ